MYWIHYPILALYINIIVTKKLIFGYSGIIELRFPVDIQVTLLKV